MLQWGVVIRCIVRFWEEEKKLQKEGGRIHFGESHSKKEGASIGNTAKNQDRTTEGG